MGAFNALFNYYKKSLIEIAEELKYKNDNIYILKDEEELLRDKFPETYANLLSCTHNKDKRSIMEYARDIVASWILEDTLICNFRAIGLNIEKAGADRDRRILPNTKVSAGSDTKIHINGKEIYMEIMCDYTGFWERTKKVDLRDDKYNRLTREKALFLGLDIRNKKYLLIDFSKSVEAEYIPRYSFYGGKPVYSIYLTKKYSLFPLQFRQLVAEIEALADGR